MLAPGVQMAVDESRLRYEERVVRKEAQHLVARLKLGAGHDCARLKEQLQQVHVYIFLAALLLCVPACSLRLLCRSWPLPSLCPACIGCALAYSTASVER